MTGSLTNEARTIRAYLLREGVMPTCDVAEELNWSDDKTFEVMLCLGEIGLVSHVSGVGWRWEGD